jgi:OHCU decarboxylase
LRPGGRSIARASAQPGASLAALNAAAGPAARATLLGCCGARRWAELVERGRPYDSPDAVLRQAERAFDALERADWLEAFAAHARVGQPHAADPRGRAEQSGVATASAAELAALAERNAAYEARFGHVFLICAAGRDAAATLAALGARYDNTAERELELAAGEQRRITRLRLGGLLAATAPAPTGVAG